MVVKKIIPAALEPIVLISHYYAVLYSTTTTISMCGNHYNGDYTKRLTTNITVMIFVRDAPRRHLYLCTAKGRRYKHR